MFYSSALQLRVRSTRVPGNWTAGGEAAEAPAGRARLKQHGEGILPAGAELV